ncbi:hypothetical protein RJ639_002637, partial [Escallonia herrerae]
MHKHRIAAMAFSVRNRGLLVREGGIPPLVALSQTGTARAKHKVRSNADLCNDILQFVSEVGLPEGHLPSLKELSQHGRQDLANIVRRRGYKLIRELLTTSMNTNVYGSDTEERSSNTQEKVRVAEDKLTGQDEKVKVFAGEVSLSTEAPMMEGHSSSMNFDTDVNFDDKSCTSIDPTKSTLQEKVANFMRNGELDTIDDSGFSILNEGVAEEGRGFLESQKCIEPEFSSFSKLQNDQVLSRTDAPDILNRSSALSSQQVVPLPSASENGTSRNHNSPTEGLSIDIKEEPDVESGEKDNQLEVNRLKSMLHQKELELSQLKQQIETEKLALSILQTKAETEISKAQEIISIKDAELHAAEESLSGLEEVQIEYWGDGDTVEVAGSFNGWHHRVQMDPQPLLSNVEPTRS